MYFLYIVDLCPASSNLMFCFLAASVSPLRSDLSALLLFVIVDSTSVPSGLAPMGLRILAFSAGGRFQWGLLAIHKISEPNTTSKTPRLLTKFASGGDALYAGFFLWKGKKKEEVRKDCFKDNLGLKTAVSCSVVLFNTNKTKQCPNTGCLLFWANRSVFAKNNLNKQVETNTYNANISFSVIPMRAVAITVAKMVRPE